MFLSFAEIDSERAVTRDDVFAISGYLFPSG
jgi:hypothetical protein